MRLSQRILGGGGDRQKSWSQAPFWSGSLAAREDIGNNFEGYIRDAYASNGVVFSVMLARQMLFSETRFAWQPRRNGRPGPLFSTADLALLERPWPNGTTGELLARMIQDADLSGNFFATTADDTGRLGKAATGPGRRIVRMRPDWVTIVLGSRSGNLYDLDTKPIAYRYKPPTTAQGDSEPVLLMPDEVVHFSPLPDPIARFRGMSWLTPVLREIKADKAASRHKLKFFEQGATISTIVSLDKDVQPAAFEAFVAKMREQTEGVDMAYKTLYLGGGADVTLNGANMQQMDFKSTQGAGETRIASAGGMHPVIVGLSEGLQGSSLNAGNFDAAIRLTADKTLRPLWRGAAASLETLLKRPGDDAALWYDDRDIAFLRDDTTDVAAIQANQAATANSLTTAGFTPESVVEFLETGDLRTLSHSGRYSVQLQAPGSTTPAAPTAPAPEE